MNDASPTTTACVLIQPDQARDSSLRGLYDEERQLFEELFALAQACEIRWVECYAMQSKRAESKSNSRRFGMGRLVTSSSGSANPWTVSELAMYGRVIGQNEGPLGLASKNCFASYT